MRPEEKPFMTTKKEKFLLHDPREWNEIMELISNKNLDDVFIGISC